METPTSLELMSLALTVDRESDGYYWVILESFDRSMVFESLVEASETYATYQAALDAGYTMLKTFSEDLNRGPVEPVDQPPLADDADDANDADHAEASR